MTNTEILEAKKYFHRKLTKLEKDLIKADDHGDSGLVMTLRKKLGYYRTAMTALNNAELELWNRSK